MEGLMVGGKGEGKKQGGERRKRGREEIKRCWKGGRKKWGEKRQNEQITEKKGGIKVTE